MGIIEWLNANSGAIIGITTVVLVGITGYYAYLTWRLLKANNTPEIAISLRPHEAHINIVMLYVENVGTGAAHNLQFKTVPASIPNLDIPLEKIGFLKSGIAYFEPGRKIEQFLVSVTGKFEELKQTPLEITVTFKDSVDKQHERTFNLDFAENQGLATIDRPPLFEIAKATKEIQKDLNHITTGFRKPIILTQPLSDHHPRQFANSLESRIEGLPEEVQEEIFQELDTVIRKREQEALKKERNEKTETDANSS